MGVGCIDTVESELWQRPLYHQGICVYQSNESALRDLGRNKSPLITEFARCSEMMWARRGNALEQKQMVDRVILMARIVLSSDHSIQRLPSSISIS